MDQILSGADGHGDIGQVAWKIKLIIVPRTGGRHDSGTKQVLNVFARPLPAEEITANDDVDASCKSVFKSKHVASSQSIILNDAQHLHQPLWNDATMSTNPCTQSHTHKGTPLGAVSDFGGVKTYITTSNVPELANDKDVKAVVILASDVFGIGYVASLLFLFSISSDKVRRRDMLLAD